MSEKKEQKDHVVVVCGYGCHLIGGDGQATPLVPYLKRVLQFVDQENPDGLIFSGGPTQQVTAPGATEAGVMAEYFRSLLPRYSCFELCDDKSYTTYDNIYGAAELIRQHPWVGTQCRITIFCETQRALKVILLARHFMRDLVADVNDIKVETYNWERSNPQRELKTTIMTWLAIKFPFLARWESEKKKRLSKNR